MREGERCVVVRVEHRRCPLGQHIVHRVRALDGVS